MKPTRPTTLLVLAAVLIFGARADAQSNKPPGPTDYPAFSRFITDRNIFDPNRYPRTDRGSAYRPRVSRAAPTFTLVGTISYRKGMFAFFDGNNSDLRQALADGGSIAGYTVTEITLTGVRLESPDRKQNLALKIGDRMRQEDGAWRLAEAGDLSADTGAAESETPSATDSSGGTASAPAASPGEGNDILKKLMQQREQETK